MLSLYNLSALKYFRACLVVRRESGELESERVKMENKDNDGKVKFVGPIKSVRQREKVCEPGIYVDYTKTSTFHTF